MYPKLRGRPWCQWPEAPTLSAPGSLPRAILAATRQAAHLDSHRKSHSEQPSQSPTSSLACHKFISRLTWDSLHRALLKPQDPAPRGCGTLTQMWDPKAESGPQTSQLLWAACPGAMTEPTYNGACTTTRESVRCNGRSHVTQRSSCMLQLRPDATQIHKYFFKNTWRWMKTRTQQTRTYTAQLKAELGGKFIAVYLKQRRKLSNQ